MSDRISQEARSALMSRVKQRDTAPEKLVRLLLHAAGYRFRLKNPKLPGRPDIMFPSRKKVIFIHGCFWHGHHCKRGKLPSSNQVFWAEKISGNRTRDARTVYDLQLLGWSALTIWECETKDSKITKGKLAKFLKQK
jgi:DNA mismatch endonuclease (patch repair protein)